MLGGSVDDLNRYLQLLSDELHKDIAREQLILLPDFLRFAVDQL